MSCVEDTADAEQQTQKPPGQQHLLCRAVKVLRLHLISELYMAAGLEWPRDCEDAPIAVLICRDLRKQNGSAKG